MPVKAAPITWGEWPAWIDEAERDGITPACRGEDPNLFFPEGHMGLRVHLQVTKAKSICERCPLLATCRQWAYTQNPAALDGIWGGTTHYERKERASFLRRERLTETD